MYNIFSNLQTLTKKALEKSILAEANLINVLQINRSDSKKIFAKDSPNNISLTTRVEPSLMKPIQQQLSAALGDKETSLETQLVKQVCIIKRNVVKKAVINA